MGRYDNRQIFENDNQLYASLFADRGIKKLLQFGTPSMPHPTAEQISGLTIKGHIWQLGDRYYKLAAKYYANPKYWWVIAWYNQKPTESHVKMGDIIDIPMPLDSVLQLLKV